MPHFVYTKSWLVGCVLRPIDSETAPHLLSLAKDVKLGFYTVPNGNQTPPRRVAVHYVTAAPRLFHIQMKDVGLRLVTGYNMVFQFHYHNL